MPVSASKRRTNNAWDQRNMAVLATKVRKETAEKFKKFCTDHGTNPNVELRKYVLQCIGEEPK